MSHKNSAVEQLVWAVRYELGHARYEAYRRALRAVGCEPQTVELLVERDREWLATGIEGDK